MQAGARVGNYRLLSELARGGMGAVWRAAAPDGHEVALKLLLPQPGHAHDADQRERLLREAMALARLRHPHVVQVLDAGEDGGVPFLVMELVAGEPLSQRLTREGPLPIREAVSLVWKLAGAVAHAHAHGVLHRDLKPQNVLVRPGGEPTLTDFGLTRDVDLDGSMSRTQTGRFMGTPGYWAPEQARGRTVEIGPHTDVYGLGALLVALLTGGPPQGAARSMMEALTLAGRPVAPPSQRRAQVDERLDAICLRALAVQAEERYPSAGALEQDLARWLRGAGPDLASSSRRPAWTAVGLFLLGASVAGAGVWTLRGRAGPASSGEPAPVASVDRAPVAVVPAEGGDPPPEEAPRQPLERLCQRLLELDLRAASDGSVQAELDRVRQELEVDRRRCLERNPPDPRGWVCEALLRRLGGDRAGTEESLQRARAAAPSWGLVPELLARVQLEVGRPQEARASATHALELDPGRAGAALLRGVAQERLGDLAAAEADYSLAIGLAPGWALPWLNRGALRHDRGDLQAAVDDYSRAVELDRNGSQGARFNRAIVLAGLHEDAAALADLDAVVAAHPEFVPALLSRGLLRAENGRYEEAEADYARALELAPQEAAAWFGRARARQALGRVAEALADAEQVVALQPQGVQGWLLCAELRAACGDASGAQEGFLRCLANEPPPEVAERAREGLDRLTRR